MGSQPSFSQALRWCQWEITTFDWTGEWGHSLLDPVFQQDIISRFSDVSCWLFDVPYFQFSSRKRMLPTSHSYEFRSEEEHQSQLGLNFIEQVVDLCQAHSRAIVSNGRWDAPFFREPQVVTWSDREGWVDKTVATCAYYDVHPSKARFVTNVLEFDELNGECWHLHDEAGAHPDRLQSAWPSPLKSASLVPPHLAFAVAVALSWWAARVLGVPMRIMRLPRSEVGGTRIGWTRYDNASEHHCAMTTLAVSLSLHPPQSQPSLRLIPTRIDASSLRSLEADMIFVGRNSAHLKATRSMWSCPFVVWGSWESVLMLYTI